MQRALPWPLIIALLLAACGGADEGGMPSYGSYGYASAQPECGVLNRVCIASGLNSPLAEGSTYDLRVESQVSGSSGTPLELAVADEAVLTASAMTLSAVGAGASAVLFLGPDRDVLDFLHVWVAPADELRILRFSADGVVLGEVHDQGVLLVGDEVLVAVLPYHDGQALMGSFGMTRDVTGDAVAIVPDVVSAYYRVVARAEGTSTLTFTALGLEAVWALEVLP
jgi:hypothetical protein